AVGRAAEAALHGHGADGRAAGDAARRAGGRRQSGADRAAGAVPPLAARRGPHHPAGRAQYGDGRRSVRPGACAGCRRGERGRAAGGDPPQRDGHALLARAAGMTAAANGTDEAILTLAQVTAGYGAITVLDGVSLRLGAREVLAVLGANGSG